jgi:CRP-like cAMP-binding protein
MVAAIRPLVALVGGRALFALDAAAQVPIVEIALLRSLRIFRALPALEGLARSMDPMRLAAGEVLIREGEPGDRFYAVADGRLRVTIGGAPAASNVRGDGIGEIALLYGGAAHGDGDGHIASDGLHALSGGLPGCGSRSRAHRAGSRRRRR